MQFILLILYNELYYFSFQTAVQSCTLYYDFFVQTLFIFPFKSLIYQFFPEDCQSANIKLTIKLTKKR